MKDPFFEDIIKELEDIHQEFPDMRFGNIIQMAIDHKKRKQNKNLSNIASKEILKAFQEFKEMHIGCRRLKTKKERQIEKDQQKGEK